jgi:P-type Ca2+ transporter type 2C
LRTNGPNELPSWRPQDGLHLLLDVVSAPVFLLLATCGAIYLMLGDRNVALMLLGFVGIVIGIRFFQQRRTERSLKRRDRTPGLFRHAGHARYRERCSGAHRC